MIIQRRSDDINDVSNKVSFYALVSLVLVFLIIVTYGWSKILGSKSTLNIDSFDFFSVIEILFIYIVALGIAVIGVVLAKGVSAERMRIAAEREPKFTNTWKAYFIVLLIISALGTINSLSMIFLQDSILSDVISKTVHDLQQLNSKVELGLSTPQYDRQRAIINQKFENFAIELKNPANCGFGDQAKKLFHELQLELPNLILLSGKVNCQNVSAQIEAYRDNVSRLTDDLPDAETKRRFNNRISMVETIKQEISKIEEHRIQSPKLKIETSKPILISAWKIYENTLGNAELLSGTSFDLPKKLEDPIINGMGGIVEVLPMLSKQFSNPAAYLIILFAVFFDVLLIEFFSRHLHASVVIREESIYSSKSGMKSDKTDNIFEK